MLTPQFVLSLHSELVIDLFAGGGGTSTGIEQAIGRHVDIAINHDPEAVSLHEVNHPQTRHFVSDVFEVDPLVVTDGQPVGLLWASPDCKHFSKAKGGKPVSKKIRSLAWVVVKWAKAVRPRMIFLENVEEFQTWGPLNSDDVPCPLRKGDTFRRWKRSLELLGYTVEHRELRACDYGAPTIRKRLFLVARCDGAPIVWPEASHGAPGAIQMKAKKLKPWRTAAECIDWSIPAPSIFERARPLADATCRRIAKGIMRYVINSSEPFIVQYHAAKRPGDDRTTSLDKPLPTQTTENRFALVTPTIAPFLTEHANASGQRIFPADEPMRTQCAQVKGGHFALVSAFLAKHYTGVVGSDLNDPMATVTSVDHHSLVTATMATVESKSDLVRAFLIKYYGTDQDPALREPLHTVTTKDRFGLVTISGTEYAIVDIGLRMLTPREIYRAQGFPDNYIIDHGADGRHLTKTAQVRMCGNSVCPPVARSLVDANFSAREERIAA